MANDRQYSTGEDEASRLLREILSPAEAQSLVMPPPDHAPASGPGESTPLTGSLNRPPSQATPARDPNPVEPAAQAVPARRGLAGYFAADARRVAEGEAGDGRGAAAPNRNGDPTYVKVFSKGQVGYLPKANLQAARLIDANLKVLDEFTQREPAKT